MSSHDTADIRHLSVADVMALHQAMMEGMGHHPAPLRDAGLLESAVLKPRTAAYYDGADLIRQAAVLAVGIAQNQPYPYNGDYMALARELEAVATRTDSLDAATRRFEDWLREHTSEA
jgi:hypothetical protein